MVLQWTWLLLQLYKDLPFVGFQLLFFGVLFSVTRRYKFWNVCVLEIGDILFTLSYYIIFLWVIYSFIYFFFDALLIIQDSRLGRGDFCSRPLFFKLVVMRCFQLLPSYWWLMLLPGSRGVLRGGSKVFLWHIPLRRAVPCLGPFEGSRSGSKIVLSGVGQTFSVRRVIYIQWYELSIRVDGLGTTVDLTNTELRGFLNYNISTIY